MLGPLLCHLGCVVWVAGVTDALHLRLLLLLVLFGLLELRGALGGLLPTALELVVVLCLLWLAFFTWLFVVFGEDFSTQDALVFLEQEVVLFLALECQLSLAQEDFKLISLLAC